LSAKDSIQRIAKAAARQAELELAFGVHRHRKFDPSTPATAAGASAASPPGGKTKLLAAIEAELRACRLCALAETRKNVVFGAGNPDADIVFIGEAPGADEDRQGLPFVGRAGKLLTKMIAYMGLTREDVYIANILKCRPPGNRDPLPSEVACCIEYLYRQLDVIAPKVIVALGRVAAHTLLETTAALKALRGKVHDYRGISLVVTYHPAYLLRNFTETEKNKAKMDLDLALEITRR